jgi:tellurite resistance protein TerC
MAFSTLPPTSFYAAMDIFVNLGAWLGFGLLIAVLVGVDLLVIHRRPAARVPCREPSMRESAITVAVWCLLALVFNAFVWWQRGGAAGVQFATGYLLEWSMSMDNVFVFAVIFRYFHVPKEHQYRVLFWGILGAVLMRLGFILAGAALVKRFSFVLPLFGLFLLYTAYRLIGHAAEQMDPSQSLVFRLARRWLPMSKEQGAGGVPGAPACGSRVGEQGAASREPVFLPAFFVREDGHLKVTPLLVVLLIVETTDLLFAVDSIPAIFGITKDEFVIFTSNVFAILGLRALYFLLAGMMDSFRYLHYGLAAVLAFVGLKMVAEGWLSHAEGSELLPPWGSLVVIVVLLGAAIVASLLAKKEVDT